MDVGVSRFWKSPPRRAAQVDICRPTWRPQDGWGGGGVPVVVGAKGRLRPYFRSGHALGVAIRGESRTRHCTLGCLDPPTPSPKGPSSEILPAGIGAIIRTLHNCDRCFFYWPDPALTGLYPERGEGGGQLVIDNINF